MVHPVQIPSGLYGAGALGQVAELEYAYGLGPYPERVVGSNPTLPIFEF